MDRKSQNKRILEFLASGRSLTPIEALRRFNVWRLSGRVLELREAGWPIVTDMVTNKRTKKRYASYTLVEK